eukprot:CAMPEP_0118943088 /NCGR_PEP_ID=MMETSP1169-20130426/37498_1 /TAXON_ID=36882 /ORGANISM="Pyramimonas obovata, Strain CCMP722" /LENGTH=38 /DNA_ID= /DNA_START= /DNA_END= /DNA_ORIENTATION=
MDIRRIRFYSAADATPRGAEDDELHHAKQRAVCSEEAP